MSLIQKYIWVVKTIHRAGRITLKELNEKWRNNVDLSRGEDLPRQTFDRWKGGILDMFGIVIEYEAKGGPARQDYRPMVWEARTENRGLEITHRAFTVNEAKTYLVEPYCVKLSGGRWYMLARSVEKGRLLLYSFDRLEHVRTTEQKFELPRDFVAKDYFADFFGIVIDENVPLQRIVLRADKYHQYYMRTLPMHYSQRELFSCDDYADFELTLRPTYDFYMRLMSWGNMIKVLEPQSLQDELRKWLRKTMGVYE